MYGWSFAARTMEEVGRTLRAMGRHRYLAGLDLQLHWSIDAAVAGLDDRFRRAALEFAAQCAETPAIELASRDPILWRAADLEEILAALAALWDPSERGDTARAALAMALRGAGIEPVGSVEELYRRSQYVSLHIPATAETKGSIGKKLLSLMPQGATLVNTARKEVINEAELLEVLAERPDFRYLSDIAPSDATAAAIKEKFDKRVYVTPNKMGAQTEEANVNAGLAAARQIVGFLERGEKEFVVNP